MKARTLILMGFLAVLLAGRGQVQAQALRVGTYAVDVHTQPDPPRGPTTLTLSISPSGASPEIQASRMDPPLTQTRVPLHETVDGNWEGTLDVGTSGRWKLTLVLRSGTGMAVATTTLEVGHRAVLPGAPPPRSLRGDPTPPPVSVSLWSQPLVWKFVMPTAEAIFTIFAGSWALAMARGWRPDPGIKIVGLLASAVWFAGAVALTSLAPVPVSEAHSGASEALPIPIESSVPVEVETATPGTIGHSIDVRAEVQAATVALVKVPQDGVVQKFLVKPGDKVEAVDSIALVRPGATPSPGPSPSPVKPVPPVVVEDDESVKSAEADVQIAITDLARARGAALAAESDVRDADAALANEKQLLDSGAIAKDEYDTKAQEAATARDGKTAADQHVAEALATLQRKKDTLDTARRMARKLQASQSTPLPDLPPLDVVATPVPAATPGQVSALLARTGAAVKAGAPLAKIVSFESVRLLSHVLTQQAAGLTPGMPVQVQVPGTSKTLDTLLVAIKRPAQGPETLLITAVLPNPDLTLGPGVTPTLHFQVIQRTNALTVPRPALAREEGHLGVWLAQMRSGHTVSVFAPVETGLDDGDRIEITRGLNPNDVVIWQTDSPLHNGTMVLVNAPPPPAPSESPEDSDSASPSLELVPGSGDASASAPAMPSP